MAIPHKCRIFAVIATLSFSLPAYAQAEGIIAGLLTSYVFSLVVALVVLVLMLLGKRTRKVLHFPILKRKNKCIQAYWLPCPAFHLECPFLKEGEPIQCSFLRSSVGISHRGSL